MCCLQAASVGIRSIWPILGVHVVLVLVAAVDVLHLVAFLVVLFLLLLILRTFLSFFSFNFHFSSILFLDSDSIILNFLLPPSFSLAEMVQS